jgi:uncharacterized protein YoxC
MVQPPNNKGGNFFERIPAWIGSMPSLILHTLFFAGIFVLGFSGLVNPDYVFALTTNILSIEAIYLAIFIQMTVNRHQRELQEVSEDVEDIQEDIEDISEDVEDLGKDVEDIQEDIEEMSEEEESAEASKQKQQGGIEQLTADVKKVLADLEALRNRDLK